MIEEQKFEEVHNQNEKLICRVNPQDLLVEIQKNKLKTLIQFDGKGGYTVVDLPQEQA